MKTFILIQTSYGETFVIRCYASKNEALKDADFIAEQKIKGLVCNEKFRERWIKVDDKWYSQCQHAIEDNVWPAWDEPYGHSSGSLQVLEYDLNEMSFKNKFAAIEHWQKCNGVHPLTCGIDSNHPLLIPKLSCLDQWVELICPFEDADGNRCIWLQARDHPVFNIIYAKYLSDGPSAS